MKHVFHIITHLDAGGAERVAFNIAKSDNPAIEYHIVEVVHSSSEFSRKRMTKKAKNSRFELLF